MKTAVVDVGGGMRGIYAAGVLDYCLDRESPLTWALTGRTPETPW